MNKILKFPVINDFRVSGFLTNDTTYKKVGNVELLTFVFVHFTRRKIGGEFKSHPNNFKVTMYNPPKSLKLKKGQAIMIDGKLELKKYEKKTGGLGLTPEIYAEKIWPLSWEENKDE